jgi:MFS family permease
VTTSSTNGSVDPSIPAEILNSATAPGGTITAPAGGGLPTGKVRVRGKLLKLMISMLVANIGIFMIWGAVPGILLPLQVESIAGGAGKAGSLAVVATIGAFAAMIAQPVAGMLSDRTRSRFGRRAPWMVAGVLIGGLALVGMGSANTIIQIAIAWVIVQITYNFAQGPLSAVLPDRVPNAVRGTFSTFAGIGTMCGALGGQVVGSIFAKSIPVGYLFFAGFALIVVVLFIVLNPDSSNKGEPRPPFSFVTFLKTFWVNPVAHPDFFWGFSGRLLLYAGYFMVTNYQLYILQDYIGLKGKAVAFVPVLGLISLVGILLATVIAGPLSDKLGRRKIVVIVAGIILAASLAFPLFMPTLTGMMIFSFVSGLGFGAYQGVDTALMSEVLPSKNDYAKDLGVLNIAATLPQTLAPGVAGLIIVVSGGYTALFPIGIVIALLGAFAVMPIKSVR